MPVERILTGEIIQFFTYDYKDGLPPEPRVSTRLAGTIWDFPVGSFIDAGYTSLELGNIFKIETPAPIGLVPKSFGAILPPIELIKGE